MARPRKEHKNLNCKIDKAIAEKLEQFVLKTRLSKTATVENALLMYIAHYDKKEEV